MTDATRSAFVWMLREEWRLHATLFGGRRFAVFPVLVAVLSAGATEVLTLADTDLGAVLAGVHALVFFFGLHTGTIGFVGRDAQRDLDPVGTMLVFTARTLPLSRRRLVAVFLAKDAVYYAGLFLLPLTLGFAPGVVDGRLVPLDVVVLWGSVTATFVLGGAVTFAAIAFSTRGMPGWVALLSLAGAAGLLWVAEDLVRLTPYALYADRTPVALAGTMVTVIALIGVGLAVYDPTDERPARSARNAFRTWHARLPFGDGLLTKTLLDVSRSSGGLFKVLFSAGVLFAVSAYLIEFAGEITGRPPSTGIAFGAILGLTGFTTYNWLTNVDSPEEYLPYPLAIRDVFRAKFRAFLLLGPPVGLVFLAVAAAWKGIRPLEALVGVGLLVGFQLYLFGVTVYLTGLAPDEFLFDTLLFAGFTLAIAVAVVPVLIVGFVLAPVPPAWLAGLTGLGVVLAGAGLALYRRAIPRWTAILRRGG